VLFGKNTVDAIGNETSLHGKNVFLLYGRKAVRNNGVLQRVKGSLEKSGCQLHEFPGISPNPELDNIRRGIELFKEKKCEVLCAVGGGSVIDTAKAISCGALVDHDVWKFFQGKKRIQQTVPLTIVSTLAGSGSETNSGMVLTHGEKKQKFGYGNRLLFPNVSILDPETTYSVPPFLTAIGSVDTICHLAEFYCNNTAPEASLQHSFIVDIIKNVFKNVFIAITKPEDYTARAQLMWSSSLALGGVVTAGLGRIGFPVHMLEHSVSAHTNSAHGAGLSVILPAWIKYCATADPEVVAHFGEKLFGITGPSAKHIAYDTAGEFRRLFTELGLPSSLGDLGVLESDLVQISDGSQPLAKLWKLREYSPETVYTILKSCL